MTAPEVGAAAAGPDPSVRYVEAGEGDAGQRIDNFLLRHLRGVPRSHLYRLLRTGQVRVDGRRVRAEHRLSIGERVRIPPVRQDAGSRPAGAPSASLRRRVTEAILYEDRELLVINKPAGIAVHGGSGLSFGIIEALRAARPELDELELVHRLDRDTSGCLLLAKRRSTLRALHALLRERDMTKRYLALVCGRWTLARKRIELPLLGNVRQGGERMVKVDARGQTAVSTFVPIEHFGRDATLMQVIIGTGRTHQIRVHAAEARHPVAGDDKYGDRNCNHRLAEAGLKRMFLHASGLEFVRPGAAGERFAIEAPLDAELEAVLEHLRGRGPRAQQALGNREP
jgi:23S rRNA pseudouridine955/2504/2580 synthase